MLEKPNLSDAAIAACLREAYGFSVGAVKFLPLDADVNTAVYRADAEDGRAWFVKLRKGPFDGSWAEMPAFLQAQGRCGSSWRRCQPPRDGCGRCSRPIRSASRQLVDLPSAGH